jgi:hypothetical protein
MWPFRQKATAADRVLEIWDDAIGRLVLTSAVTPASAARRHVGWRNAAVAAGIATAAAAAASGAYYSGYGFGGYGYGGRRGRCGGGALLTAQGF